jgi:hypothetical protein
MGWVMKCLFRGAFALIGCLAASNAQVFAEDAEATIPTSPDIGCSRREPNLNILVRSDFTDLGPLTCTHDLISAQGATFSWTNNLLTGQNSAAADGLAILDYTQYGGPGNLVGYSFGPYVQGDDTYQAQPTPSQAHNMETITTGGFAEVAFVSPILSGFDDFRVRDGEAFANPGATSNSFVGEWIPSYKFGPGRNVGLPNEVGHTGLYYTISPELMVQYDQLDSGKSNALIFSTGTESLRIGPEANVLLNIDESQLPANWPKTVRDFFGNTSALITNHESWDTYSGRQYSWTAVSFTYTFPGQNNQPSHLGVTASYGYGNLEASANKANQVKVGLAVKF